MDARVWLEGEIQDVRWSRAGDLRFTLRGDGVQLECVVWRSHAVGLRERLGNRGRCATASSRDPIKIGDLVAVRGRLSLDHGRVCVRFVATDIQLTGLAAAALERERVRAALERDGLLSPARKRRLPRLPRLIALVTSPGSAAEADVLAAAHGRHSGVRVQVVPAHVQGDAAPRSLVDALERAAALDGCDVVLLCRGGGSAGELAAFDDEAVVRAIARCPVPVVAGIGHETDITLADLVADVRALTPTAAAVAAVPLRAELEAELARLHDRLQVAMRRRIARELERVRRAGSGIGQAVALRTADARRRLDRLSVELERTMPRRLTGARQKVERVESTLRAQMTHVIAQACARRDVVGAQIAALAPTAVLRRGYAIPRTTTGDVLGRVADFEAVRTFVLTVSDGDVVAQVLSVSTNSTLTDQNANREEA